MEKTDNKRFLLSWPRDLHKIVKVHALLRSETINSWVTRCVVEQLEREKTYTAFAIKQEDK
jgi:hypothetical protein